MARRDCWVSQACDHEQGLPALRWQEDTWQETPKAGSGTGNVAGAAEAPREAAHMGSGEDPVRVPEASVQGAVLWTELCPRLSFIC